MSGRRSLRVLALAAAMSVCLAATAAASPPRPTDLRVVGGDTWHADNRFTLIWTSPASTAPALSFAGYRIRNPQGTAVVEGQANRGSDSIAGLAVPKVAGVYNAEVWFEDTAGTRGPTATASLRFDDVRPAPIALGPVPDWIGRPAFPLRVRLGHPPGPAPISGIGGYAVAIDSLPDGSPCVAIDRCTATETTLKGGAGGDELDIGSLPEGTSYLHALAVSGSGMKSATADSAVLRVDITDPVTHLSELPDGWTNRTVSLIAVAGDTQSGLEPGGKGPSPFTAIQVDDSAPAIALGGSVSVSVIGEGLHRIAYYARDAAGNSDDGATTNGVANRPPRTAWVKIDRTPPAAGFANAQDPDDPDLLRVRIADDLSGPDPTRSWIGVRRAGSGDRFDPLPAVPAGVGELCARWNSDAYPEGNYEFRAVAYDLAGNDTVTARRRNGASMILSNPLKATTTLRVGFRRGLQRTAPYGRRLLLSGRLVTGRSSPLRDAPIRVIERFAAGARPATRVSALRTGPSGDFSLRTAPGPSRTIAISFEGGPTLARSAARTLQLGVRSRVRLSASAGIAEVGGAPLIFAGRVVTPPGESSAGGKSVELQFRLPGGDWTEFRTVRADAGGHFRYAYSFSDDDSRGVRFQFRAFAPKQADWPYEPAGSRPILVRGI
jgi:hypothetical protein